MSWLYVLNFLHISWWFVQIPLSSKNDELQPLLAGKRRIVALNKKDLANPNIMHVMCVGVCAYA